MGPLIQIEVTSQVLFKFPVSEITFHNETVDGGYCAFGQRPMEENVLWVNGEFLPFLLIILDLWVVGGARGVHDV